VHVEFGSLFDDGVSVDIEVPCWMLNYLLMVDIGYVLGTGIKYHFS
jgi:hypothetical protein